MNLWRSHASTNNESQASKIKKIVGSVQDCTMCDMDGSVQDSTMCDMDGSVQDCTMCDMDGLVQLALKERPLQFLNEQNLICQRIR